MTTDAIQPVGVVAIGRNEGERLRLCFESLLGRVEKIVYVDSASTDGSVAMARQLGVEVVELDMSIPFSAGRARNEGFTRLLRVAPHLQLVQFMDGDCALDPAWLPKARRALLQDPKVAGVCGRRRERFPDKTLYNRMCDIEWNTPVGETRATGGDFMIRAAVFKRVGGFNPAVIAGEEPEMGFRIREAGWKIVRIDAEMTLHDAAMTRFGQWWKRTVRGGHAYAQGFAMHGGTPERYYRKQTRSIWVWAMFIPLLIVALIWPTHGWSLLLLLIYPLQTVRLALRYKRGGMPPRDAWPYAFFLTLGKWAELRGMLKFYRDRSRGKHAKIIEYK
jgi:GT2 family glycosyltransferase